MKVAYPFTPGSSNREVEPAHLFDYRNGDPKAKPDPFGAGCGGQFEMTTGQSFALDTSGIHAGKYATITRSATFTPDPHAQVTVLVNKQPFALGPGESCKVRAGNTATIESSTGGTFCLQSQHS